MADEFENHCWKDTVPPDVLDIYSHYIRKTFVGPAPALLAIDLYELAYQGGAKPVAQLHKTYPSTCGENAHAARCLDVRGAPSARPSYAGARAELGAVYPLVRRSPLRSPVCISLGGHTRTSGARAVTRNAIAVRTEHTIRMDAGSTS